MKMCRTGVGAISAVTFLLSTSLYAEYSVENNLKAFKENPKAYMNDHRNVQKYLQVYTDVKGKDSQGKEKDLDEENLVLVNEVPIEPGAVTKFSKESVENKNFITEKNKFHEALGIRLDQASRTGRAAIEPNDRPEDLIGDLKIRKLSDMDGRLRSAKLPKAPWSSYYWAIYLGGTAFRYNDNEFPASTNWKENSDFIMGRIAAAANANSSSIENLSAAEKYDLLVGDKNWALTKAALKDGQGYHQQYGKVETWMGICNGWAAAAFREERPKRAIEVMSADGVTKIKFFPADIKALASLLWAKTPPSSKFIGSRCNKKSPAMDASGRVLDKDCFDTNPGTWHLTVVNQIGINKESFVLDATYDYEVWNQPAYSYEYTYFNPKTNKPTSSLKEASVSIDDPEFVDQFKNFRPKEGVKTIVGVAMKFVYIAETSPKAQEKDKEIDDKKVAVNYLYDLELDKDGNIVGGEWYHNQHPDFLWLPTSGVKAKSRADSVIASSKQEWKKRSKKPMPVSWQEAASEASTYGQPVGRIVRELIQKSNQTIFLGIHMNFSSVKE